MNFVNLLILLSRLNILIIHFRFLNILISLVNFFLLRFIHHVILLLISLFSLIFLVLVLLTLSIRSLILQFFELWELWWLEIINLKQRLLYSHYSPLHHISFPIAPFDYDFDSLSPRIIPAFKLFSEFSLLRTFKIVLQSIKSFTDGLFWGIVHGTLQADPLGNTVNAFLCHG